MSTNSCYTYFEIVGKFDPDKVTSLLGLTPDKTHKIGDTRKNGTKYDFAVWKFGTCADYDAEVEHQMRETLSPLQDKIDLLNRIRNGNDVRLFLSIVPSVYADSITPCLAPPLDVIDFCHATRTEIDIDLYVYGS